MQLEANKILNKETTYSLILKMTERLSMNFKKLDQEFNKVKDLSNIYNTIKRINSFGRSRDIIYFKKNVSYFYDFYLDFFNEYKFIALEELNIIEEIKTSELSNNIKTTLYNELEDISYLKKRTLKFISFIKNIEEKENIEDKIPKSTMDIIEYVESIIKRSDYYRKLHIEKHIFQK